ncbi:MAG: flagellar basal body protein FliL, partial [Treponema sp.]|nr:flagellar basal body protein FliL [Treponema sp.]
RASGNRGGSEAGGPAGGAVSVFSGIGTLRIPAAGQQAATVILSISFPYPADDLPFTEELASRIGEFRSIATGYFASLSREQIARLDENEAKSEILKRYNALLRLGKIETLYFSDLMIVE